MSQHVQLSAVQARRAGALAAAATSLCLGAAVALVAWMRPRAWSSIDDVVESAVLCVAVLALLRLAGGCTVSATSFFRIACSSARAPARVTSPTRHEGEPGHPVLPRGRIAGFFVALATVSVLTTQAANAAPGPPSPSFATSMTLADTSPHAGSEAPGTPLPDFAPSSTAPALATTPDPAPQATIPHTLSPTQDAAAQARAEQIFAAVAHRDGGAPPLPGWTPSARADTPRAAPLVVGGVQDLTNGERGEHRRHVVMRGESLWSIAAHHLAPGAPPERVLQSLEAWLQANPQLRTDPDLLHPGEVLLLPQNIPPDTPRPDRGSAHHNPLTRTTSGDRP